MTHIEHRTIPIPGHVAGLPTRLRERVKVLAYGLHPTTTTVNRR